MENVAEDIVAFYYRKYRKNGTLSSTQRLVGKRIRSSATFTEILDSQGRKYIVRNSRVLDPTKVEKTAWRLGI